MAKSTAAYAAITAAFFLAASGWLTASDPASSTSDIDRPSVGEQADRTLPPGVGEPAGRTGHSEND